jgi:hypothetical protein
MEMDVYTLRPTLTEAFRVLDLDLQAVLYIMALQLGQPLLALGEVVVINFPALLCQWLNAYHKEIK